MAIRLGLEATLYYGAAGICGCSPGPPGGVIIYAPYG